jgi:uncharacterized protein (DUF362 family)
MKLSPDCVYIARHPVAGNEAPFEEYQQLAHKALDTLELDLPETGDLCLKPNATVLYEPAKRIIVHPGFLAGMIESLTGRGIDPARLIVGDGQSGEDPDKDHTWKMAGYTDAIGDRGAILMPYNNAPARDVVVDGGVVYDRYPIYTAVTDSSFFFNIPLAKCHNLGCTTLSIKNLMGILARPERHLCSTQEVDEPIGAEALIRLGDSGYSVFEERFYHKLCDLLVALRSLELPRLTVVDGLIGRDGTAFNEGANYPLGWSLVGVDEVSVDTVGTWLMGLDPLATPYLQFAAARKLGTIRLEEIDVVDIATGDKLSASELEEIRRSEPLMPLSRTSNGYYARFRDDGSAVPWRIHEVNEQRAKDGLEPVPFDLVADAHLAEG